MPSLRDSENEWGGWIHFLRLSNFSRFTNFYGLFFKEDYSFSFFKKNSIHNRMRIKGDSARQFVSRNSYAKTFGKVNGVAQRCFECPKECCLKACLRCKVKTSVWPMQRKRTLILCWATFNWREWRIIEDGNKAVPSKFSYSRVSTRCGATVRELYRVPQKRAFVPYKVWFFGLCGQAHNL